MKEYKAGEVIETTLQVYQTTYGSMLFIDSDETNWYQDEGYLHLATFQVKFPVKETFNMKADQIAALEARKARLTRVFNETIGKLNDEITKLQALEFNGEQTQPGEDDDIPF